MNGRHTLNDPFAVSILLAVGLHAVLLLAVSFALDLNPLRKAAETLRYAQGDKL